MIRFLICLFSLTLLLPAHLEAAVLLDLQSSEGDLQARLVVSGDTLLADDQGQPWLTAADQLLCTLTVSSPEDMDVTLPVFTGPNFGDFTLLDQGEPQTRRTSQGLEHELHWLIEPYNPGPYQLPEIVVVAHRALMNIELILPRPELVAKKIGADNENLNDILPPQAPGNFPIPILLTGLALVVFALVFWFFLSRKNKGTKPLPPQKRALLEMENLANLLPRDKVERLAFILRCYIDSRFELCCCEQTYDEYASGVNGCEEIPKESRATFLDILKRSDLIKFSNIDPQPDEAEDMITQARKALLACPLAEPDDKVCGRW